MEIIKTSNYNDFQFVMSNREVDKNHVKKLAASIQKKNLLFVRPLIVNSRMEVIDGQHRLAAAQQINAPVYYIKCDGLTKEDIAVLNTAQKNWTRMDFINFYAIEGRQEFKDLCKLINKYPLLKVSFILRAIGECKNLRQGNLKVTNLNYAYNLCDVIMEMYGCGFTFVIERDFGIASLKRLFGRALKMLIQAINVCWNCKVTHYRSKFQDPALRHLYSELPVVIPPAQLTLPLHAARF